MPVLCWGCENKVTPVGVAPAELPLDPVGTCSGCNCFACRGHGRRMAGPGKFLCYPCVGESLAEGAGVVPIGPAGLKFTVLSDFEEQFPELAQETLRLRSFFATGAGEPLRLEAMQTLGVRGTDETELLSAALGVGAFLSGQVPTKNELGLHRTAEAPLDMVVPSELAPFVGEDTP